MKHLTYAIDSSTGLVISRIFGTQDKESCAIPILNFNQMSPETDFETTYTLTKISVNKLLWDQLKWTKKVSVMLRNVHREFWGFSLLPMNDEETKAFEVFKDQFNHASPDSLKSS